MNDSALSFQASKGLPATGTTDAATWQQVNSRCFICNPMAPSRRLKPSMPHLNSWADGASSPDENVSLARVLKICQYQCKNSQLSKETL